MLITIINLSYKYPHLSIESIISFIYNYVMVLPSLYDRKHTLTTRIISSLFVILFIIFTILSLYNIRSSGFNAKLIFSLILNFILITLGIFLLIFPIHIEILATISFIYSTFLFFTNPESILCIPLYYLGISICILKGFFNKKTKLKITFSFVVLIFLIFVEFFFNKKAFITSLIEKITLCLVLSFSLLFLYKYFQQKLHNTSTQVLNLANYQKLSFRDLEILLYLQKNLSYKTIAEKLLLSPGTIRNRVSFIFKQISIADKKEFMNIFSNAKIIFEPGN